MTSMYERVGGEPTLRRLCETFHELVMADPLLRPLFEYGRGTHVDHLTAFFVEMFGGPAEFSRRLGGIGRLYHAHRERHISEAARQRFVELMVAAARTSSLPQDEEFMAKFTHNIENGSMFSYKFSQPGATLAKPYPPMEPWVW